MNGLVLLRTFDAIYLITIGTWLGSLAFIEAVVAPSLRAAGRADLVAPIRARGALWGAICGAIALPALVCGSLAVPEMRGPDVAVRAAILLAGLLLMFPFAAPLSASRTTQRREPFNPAKSDQARPHSFAACAVALGLAGLLALHAFRRPPQSQGIVEPSPVNRHRAFVERASKPLQPRQDKSSESTHDQPATPSQPGIRDARNRQ